MLSWTCGAAAGVVTAAHGRRRRLQAGASSLALAMLTAAAPALADTTVNGGSSPVATATANNGAPDNISQTGTLNVSAGTAGITLNSNNTVTNSGTIQGQDVDNATGILVLGGHTGAVTNSGSITFSESATTTTTNSTGDVVGPFAKGTGRYGIRVTGPGDFTGSISDSGPITIQGNDSAGISIETRTVGALTSSGAISVNGDRSVGIRSTAPITGGVSITSGVAAAGTGAQAVSLSDVGGGVAISGALSATGYHSTVRPTTASVISDLNANDAAQGGVALQLGGDVAGGVLIAAPPATVSSTVTDANGDGIADATEGTGGVSSFGGAPAILIGGAGRSVTVGAYGTGDYAYGLIINGSVTGSALRDGVSATGVQLGVTGGGAVNVAGGVRVGGSSRPPPTARTPPPCTC
jgi:hypothetical protein